MNSTAIGATYAGSENRISFISEAHESFFFEKMEQIRYQDTYHMALIYCLGINADTRQHIDRIYDFKTGCVKPECLNEGWITSGSARVIRLAFNLYCGGIPSVDEDIQSAEEQADECRQYAVDEIFCCAYAPYFWQAIQIRYPEYAAYNNELHQMLGGRD